MPIAYESFFFGGGPARTRMYSMYGDNGAGADGGSTSAKPQPLANGRSIMSIASLTDGPNRGVYTHVYGMQGPEIDLASAVVKRLDGADNNYSAGHITAWPISGNNFLAEFFVGSTNTIWVMSFDGVNLDRVSVGDASWPYDSRGIMGKSGTNWISWDGYTFVQVNASGNRAGGLAIANNRPRNAFAPDGSMFMALNGGDEVYKVNSAFSATSQIATHSGMGASFGSNCAGATSNYYVLGGNHASDVNGYYQGRLLIYDAADLRNCRSVSLGFAGNNRVQIVKLEPDPADPNTMFFVAMGDGEATNEWRRYYFGSINLVTGAINWCREVSSNWYSQRILTNSAWIYPTATSVSFGWSDNYDANSSVFRARIVGPGPRDASFPTGTGSNVRISAVTATTSTSTTTGVNNGSATASSAGVQPNYVATRNLATADISKITVASTNYFGG